MGKILCPTGAPNGEFERRNVYEVKKIAGCGYSGCAGDYDNGCYELYGECVRYF